MASNYFSQSGSNDRSLATLGLPSGLVAALSRAGYETINDLSGTSEAELSEELGLKDGLHPNLLNHLPGGSSASQFPRASQAALPSQPIPASRILTESNLGILRKPSTAVPTPLVKPRTYMTPSLALNTLLSTGALALRLNRVEAASSSSEGGLRSMFILEISGPPGSGKGCLALELIRSAVTRGEGVLMADTQSSMTPGRIYKALDGLELASNEAHDEHPANLVLRTYLSSLPHVIAFVKTLPIYLEANPKVVITSQTSTRMIGPEGSSANFDTGSRAVLVSQLGEPCRPPIE
ncbi:hypothetical protein FRB97_007385 [Tulasnella sp. 331]|nr:hypothetical protein FRB97_007385 [Tulasnella sp. 331]